MPVCEADGEAVGRAVTARPLLSFGVELHVRSDRQVGNAFLSLPHELQRVERCSRMPPDQTGEDDVEKHLRPECF